MLPELELQLRSNWEDLFGGRQPRRVTWLGIPGGVENGTTTFLMFAGGERPVAVAKIFRHEMDAPRASAEHDLLSLLATSLAPTVPRPVLVVSVGGRAVLVTSAVPGVPMSAAVAGGLPRVEEADRQFRQVVEWLSRLARLTGRTASDSHGRSVVTPIDRFEELFPVAPDEAACLAQLRSLAASLGARTGVRHGDFTRHNILVRGDGIAVVDWTDATRDANLPHDIFAFATTYGLQLRTRHGAAGLLEAFLDTFFRANAFSEVVCRHVRSHCASIGVDPDLIRDLLVLHLVERAITDHDRIVRSVSRGHVARGTVMLAQDLGLGPGRLPEAQVWLLFFRELVRRRTELLL